MPCARLKAIEEVDALIASGELVSFEDWQKVVKHPADPGVRGLEGGGSEFEGDFQEEEVAWLTPEEQAGILLDDAEALAREIEAAP